MYRFLNRYKRPGTKAPPPLVPVSCEPVLKGPPRGRPGVRRPKELWYRFVIQPVPKVNSGFRVFRRGLGVSDIASMLREGFRGIGPFHIASILREGFRGIGPFHITSMRLLRLWV